MNTIQVNQALNSRWDIPLGVFKGTYASNQVPLLFTQQRPFAMVVNTAPLPEEGEHWVALFGSSENPNQLEVFDTGGKRPNFPFVLNMIDFGKVSRVVYNSRQLQSDCTTVCGEYCILFLYCRILGVAFKEFLSWFSYHHLLQNDRVVYTIVHRHFDIIPHKRPYPVNMCMQTSKSAVESG